MVLVWQNFLLMTANGFTLASECWRVFLPAKNEDAVIEYARNRFVQKGGQGVEELVQGMTSVALMAFSISIWARGNSIDVTNREVSAKLMNEFVSEITPLWERASPETRKAVYELAWGKAPKSSTFLNERLFLCFFPGVHHRDRQKHHRVY